MKITPPAKLKIAREMIEQGIPYNEIKRRIGKKFDTSIGTQTLTRIRREIMKSEGVKTIQEEISQLRKDVDSLKEELKEIKKKL